MPSRRTFLTGASLGLSGLLAPATAAGALPRPDDRPSVDVPAVLESVGAVHARVSGGVTPTALRDLHAVDLDRVPGLRGVDAVPDVDPRLVRAAGSGRPALGSLAGALDATLQSADGPVTGSLDGTDAHAVVTLADGPFEGRERALSEVERVGFGVDLDASRVRVAVEGVDGPVSTARARGALRALGVPAALLDGATASVTDETTVLTRSFDAGVDAPGRLDDDQPFVVVLFLVVAVAVVGTFVLGLGNAVGSASGGASVSGTARESRGGAPQVSLSFEYRSGESVTITHDGGDNVEADRLQVTYTADGQRRVESWESADGQVTAGDTHETDAAPDPDTDVRVVWTGEDRAVTLGLMTTPP